MNSQPHPIILVEGLDGVGKSTLVNALATKLSAELIRSPPKIPDPVVSKSDLRIRMDETGPCTRREYYRCGNFHASLLIEEARKNRPVVLDRYWPTPIEQQTRHHVLADRRKTATNDLPAVAKNQEHDPCLRSFEPIEIDHSTRRRGAP